MVAEVRIYCEGHPALRPGFAQFFGELAQGLGRRPRFIAGGATAVQDFQTALRKHPQAMNLLLKDSEGPDDGTWFESLGIGPERKESVFWMVQCMESWFVADPESLKRYYGQEFREKTIAGNPNVEDNPKRQVIDGLRDATKGTPKGPYHKTKHAPHLLGLIRPERVKKASPHCRRLFESVPRIARQT
ncbi:MAG: DUF4276 family protein [Acidobacteriia bacterium]|nr:DUF4276 family protein [Terriglobia bacterium]